MNENKWVRLCCLLLGLVVLSSSAVTQDKNNEVVAEVNGTKITRAELEQEQASKLLQIRYQLFVAEQKALSDVIDNRLLAIEAARQHITMEQLADREIRPKLKDPSEEELQFLYDQSNATEPYDAVREKLLDMVHHRMVAKMRTAYLQQLGSQATVFITLAPPVAEFAVGNAPHLGATSAAVQLVEFADYECPYCSKVYPHVMKLHEEFGDQLSIYFKDMPLPMHAHARKAAEAAHCAGVQGKFWEYHGRLFSSRELELPQLKKYARDLNLDGALFDKCVDSGEQAAAVQKDLAQAQQLGLTGTPSFFVDKHFISGAVDYDTLRDLVTQQLKLKNKSPELSKK
jgi:protein-disulfide isomerase